MSVPRESLPYQVQINNFLYDLAKQPYKIPTEADLAAIEEEEFAVNRIYGEAVRPVVELIHMGRIEEALEKYDSLSGTQPMEAVKVKVKKQ